MSDVEKKSFNGLAVGYAAISIVGLIAVSYGIVRSLSADSGPFLDALFGNWTSTVLLVDLLIAAVAAIVWAITEAKRLGMNWILWLVLMLTTPFAFSLPLFLALREKRRAELLRTG